MLLHMQKIIEHHQEMANYHRLQHRQHLAKSLRNREINEDRDLAEKNSESKDALNKLRRIHNSLANHHLDEWRHHANTAAKMKHTHQHFSELEYHEPKESL